MSDDKNKLLVPIAIVIAGALIGLGVYFSNKGIGGVPDAGNQRQGAESSKAPTNSELLKGAVTVGDPHAKVVMVEFADFQCPFCGKFFKESSSKIIDSYVKTGKVLFAYQDFAFLGPESVDAAVAAHCANDQGKFTLYHDALYNHIWDNYYAKEKNGENVGAFSKDTLKKIARDLNLDSSAFGQCLDSAKYATLVEEATRQGRAFGVTGTPAFFINGKVITGALPYSEFQKAIEDELKK